MTQEGLQRASGRHRKVGLRLFHTAIHCVMLYSMQAPFRSCKLCVGRDNVHCAARVYGFGSNIPETEAKSVIFMFFALYLVMVPGYLVLPATQQVGNPGTEYQVPGAKHVYLVGIIHHCATVLPGTSYCT